MTATPQHADVLRERFTQVPQARPLAHQLTLPQLVDALHAIRTANTDHAALCSEAAHRLQVMHQGNTQLAEEGDRLRGHMRAANARIDDMRNNLVSLNGRIDDMRRASDPLALHPATFLTASRLREPLQQAISQAIGQASMCWDKPGGAGTFKASQAKDIATKLAARIAEEIDLARNRRRASDGQADQVDWRRRALDAEHRADTMQAGMLHTKLDRMNGHARDGADEGDLPTAREIFNAITTRMRRAFWRKKDPK